MLIDHDPANFTANLETFVTQIPEVDYLNLFLAGVGYVLPFTLGSRLIFPSFAPSVDRRSRVTKSLSYAMQFVHIYRTRI